MQPFFQLIVQLIGEKSRVACKMNDAATEVWLNTGAHVSLLSHKWLESKLPEVKILEVGELLDSCDSLQVSQVTIQRYHYLGGLI